MDNVFIAVILFITVFLFTTVIIFTFVKIFLAVIIIFTAVVIIGIFYMEVACFLLVALIESVEDILEVVPCAVGRTVWKVNLSLVVENPDLVLTSAVDQKEAYVPRKG